MEKMINKLLIVLTVCVVTPAAFADQDILGWLETAYLKPGGIPVKAKLDTGARTSSIYAINIVPFEVDGEIWVRFTLPKSIDKTKKLNSDIELEKPVIRETKIKEHYSDSVSRYVVKIDLCLNGQNFSTPATLADRSNFHYPLLLGRRTMENKILVDPGKTNLANKSCLHKD